MSYLIVIKEKNIFQDEGLHCLSNQEVGQGPAEGNRSRHCLGIDEVMDLSFDVTMVANFSLGAFLPGKGSILFSTGPRALPWPRPSSCSLGQSVAQQHPDLRLQPVPGHLPVATTAIFPECKPDCDSVLLKIAR